MVISAAQSMSQPKVVEFKSGIFASDESSPVVGPGHHFFSAPSILMWLEKHLGALGDLLSDSMEEVNKRDAKIKELQAVKSHMSAGNTGWGNWQKEVDDLAARYPNDTNVQQLKDSVHEMVATMPSDNPTTDAANGMSNQFQSVIDGLSKDDQLATISVQDLNSQVNNALQLASNILKGLQDAIAAGVRNIA